MVQVPVVLAKVFSRARDLRNRHGEWARGKNESKVSTELEESNESHAYYLSILERTQEILKPCMPSLLIDDFLLKPSLRSGDKTQPELQANRQISNMFDSLDVKKLS